MATPFYDFLHDLKYTDLPPEVVRYARRWLLDLIGVAAGGSTTDLSRIIRDHAAAHFGAGDRRARMLFDGRSVSPAGAALAGGMTIDALDGHDGHKLTKGHVGCGVFPAALALAEAEEQRRARSSSPRSCWATRSAPAPASRCTHRVRLPHLRRLGGGGLRRARRPHSRPRSRHAPARPWASPSTTGRAAR